MYLFDLKQKFTSKHPMPFTKADGYFKIFCYKNDKFIYVMKYACLSFYHKGLASYLWGLTSVLNLIYSVVKIHPCDAI